MKRFVLTLAEIAARWLPARAKQGIYRLPWLSGAVRSSLNRAAPQVMTVVRVAGGALAGCRLSLDMQSEKDYWLGTYEPQLQAGIQDLIKAGMTAYDIGANIGYITLLLAGAVGETGEVHTFEALPDNLDRLRQNLALNDLQSRVTVAAAALVDRSGPVTFWVGPSGGMGKADGSAGRSNIPYTESILVDGISLDDYVYRQDHPAPDMVKIDIEGGEVLALPGMRRVLAEARPLVFLELHGPEAAIAAWEALAAANYRLCYLKPGYPQVASLEALDWKAYLVAFPGGWENETINGADPDEQHAR